jgi:hypothetical protein
MGFELHITLPEDSKEAQAIHQVALAEHVTPEQAAKILLAEGAKLRGAKTPAEEFIGAFSSPEDAALLDEIVAEAYAMRRASEPRDFGL